MKRSASLTFIAALSLLVTGDLAGTPSWFPFVMPWDDATAAFINSAPDRPAGHRGPVSAKDGHFYFADGTRARFWGMSMAGDVTAPPPAVAEATANRLAKLGFNLVRFVTLDTALLSSYSNRQSLDPQKLERFDQFVYHLKQNGLYINFPLFTEYRFRAFQPGDGITDREKLNGITARLAAYFDEGLFNLQKDFARKLFSHRNSKTGTVYATEPAIASVELLNEMSLIVGWQSNRLNAEHTPPDGIHLTPFYSAELDRRWNSWLLQRYGTRQKLASVWAGDCTDQKGLLPDEDPSKNTVRRIVYARINEYCYYRLIDTLRFYQEAELEYFKLMRDFLRIDLGVKAPVAAVSVFAGMADMVAQASLDYVNQNIYWQHPCPFPNGFMAPPFEVFNTAMVRAELDVLGRPVATGCEWAERRNTIYGLSFAGAIEGKPVIVSEYNHPAPNEYQSEFPLLIAAYGSFQDWDGVILHDYGMDPQRPNMTHITDGFQTFNNPAVLTQMPAASRIFRERRVRPGLERSAVPYTYDHALLWNFFCTTNLYCYLGDVKADPTGRNRVGRTIDPHLSLVKRVRSRFAAVAEHVPATSLSSPYVSDTGELRWDLDRGLVTIDAATIQAAVGFLDNPAKPIELSHLAVQSRVDFAAIGLITLDGLPIATSQRMLLTTAGRCRNTDLKLERNNNGLWTLMTWGRAPLLCQPIEADVRLKLSAGRTVRVFRLNERGQPSQEVTVSNLSSGQFSFTIGAQGTLWYAVMVSP